jgi:predicted nucleic acid-binding protein
VIVVDTNIIAYLLIEGEKTENAVKLLELDDEWAAPFLWRSEFRNILSNYLRKKLLTLDKALELVETATELMIDNEYAVASIDVLSLSNESGYSAYNCEFVSLAKNLGCPLITTDKKLVKVFPKYAMLLENYIKENS